MCSYPNFLIDIICIAIMNFRKSFDIHDFESIEGLHETARSRDTLETAMFMGKYKVTCCCIDRSDRNKD